MTTLEDNPPSTLFSNDSQELNPEQRCDYLRLKINGITEKLSYPPNSPPLDSQTDSVCEYAQEVLSLGLLLMEFADAIASCAVGDFFFLFSRLVAEQIMLSLWFVSTSSCTHQECNSNYFGAVL